MTAARLIAYVASGVLMLFGVLYLGGAFHPQGQAAWVGAGLACLAGGIACLWLGARRLRP